MAKNQEDQRRFTEEKITSIYWDGDKAVDIIKELQEAIATYGDSVFIERVYEYGDDTWYMKYKRPETDTQMEIRLRNEAEAAARQEQWDRQQWERLSKKYGTGS